MRGRLAGPPDRRGARRRRAGRVRRDARDARGRPRARAGGAARPPAGLRAARSRRPPPRSLEPLAEWRAAARLRARRAAGRPRASGWTRRAAVTAPRRRRAGASGDGTGADAQRRARAFVPDAPGADLLVGAARVLRRRRRSVVAIEAAASGVAVEAVMRYDATRSLGHVTFDGARGATLLDAPDGGAGGRLVPGPGADRRRVAGQRRDRAASVGRVRQGALHVRARDRLLPGRQALLDEVLRQRRTARSLLYYAGWSRNGAPHEFPLAASAARSVAGRALDYASRTMISVHGGIGATWEHDAPAVLPPRPALAAPARRPRRRDRPRRRRVDRPGGRRLGATSWSGWQRRRVEGLRLSREDLSAFGVWPVSRLPRWRFPRRPPPTRRRRRGPLRRAMFRRRS